MRTLTAAEVEVLAPVPLAAESDLTLTYTIIPDDNTTSIESSSSYSIDWRAVVLIIMGIVAGILLILISFQLYKNRTGSTKTTNNHATNPKAPTGQYSIPQNPTESSAASPPASFTSNTSTATPLVSLHPIPSHMSQYSAKQQQRVTRITTMHCTEARSLSGAAALHDSTPEEGASMSSLVSTRQKDPEILSAFHDAESTTQTCTDHLEVRVGGTTGVTSLTSRPSQELAEVLSMGLSGNPMQTSPEHLHCIDDQQSGSWNISAFDEAAAQIQGASDNRITSALNDDFEYCLPANLKLVGGSGDVEGEKLNTAFERRVLRRLERFLSKLPDKEASRSSSSPTLDAELSGKKCTDSASTSGDESISLALTQTAPSITTTTTISCPQAPSKPPHTTPGTTSIPEPNNQLKSSASPSAAAPHGPLPQQPECTSAAHANVAAADQTEINPLYTTMNPEGPETSFHSISAPKSAARKLLESSGLASAQEAAYTAKRGSFSKISFRRLPPLEERASQESASVSASATLSCSTAQSISGPPEACMHFSSASAPQTGIKLDPHASQRLLVSRSIPNNPLSGPRCDPSHCRGTVGGGCQYVSQPQFQQVHCEHQDQAHSAAPVPDAIAQRLPRVCVPEAAAEQSSIDSKADDNSGSGSQPSTPVYVPVSADSDIDRMPSGATGSCSEPSSEERSWESGTIGRTACRKETEQQQWERAFAARCKALAGTARAASVNTQQQQQKQELKQGGVSGSVPADQAHSRSPPESQRARQSTVQSTYVPPDLHSASEGPGSHCMHATEADHSSARSRSAATTPAEASTVTLKPPAGATEATFYSSHISSTPLMHSVNASPSGGVMSASPSDSGTTLGRRKSIDCEPKLSANLLPTLQEGEVSLNEIRCLSSASLGSPSDALNYGASVQAAVITTPQSSGSGSGLLQTSSNLYISAVSTAGGVGVSSGDIHEPSPL